MHLEVYLHNFEKTDYRQPGFCHNDTRDNRINDDECFYTPEEYEAVPDFLKSLFTKGAISNTFVLFDKCLADVLTKIGVDPCSAATQYVGSYHCEDGFVYHYKIVKPQNVTLESSDYCLFEIANSIMVYYKLSDIPRDNDHMILSLLFDEKYESGLYDYDGIYSHVDVADTYSILLTEVDNQTVNLSSDACQYLKNMDHIYDKSVVDLLIRDYGLDSRFSTQWVDGHTALYAIWFP